MPATKIAFVTPPDAPGWQRWLVLSPAARIVFFAAMLIGFSFLIQAFIAMSGWAMKSASPLQHALANLSLRLLPALAGYLILVRLIERRRVDELAPRDIPTFGTAGLVIGAVMFSLVVAVLWLAGSYHVTGSNPQVDWIPAVLVAGIGAGIGEEIVVRGVLFRIVEEGLGSWWALLISALFFGAAHLANPAATLWSSAAIAIEAGILLALLYAVTRSLWACIGLHAAWNIMQGTVYGIPVSGTKPNGWLVSYRTGPDWLSGGAFGAEASVVALALGLLLSAILLVIALRRGAIVPCRPWQRLLQRPRRR
ncbi:MAG TPA: type II CAAX endopeptidase family protein [Rhodanobacter sp.]|nr:type II CAAX endopeptidase family protein [Rhodanobacter sp.]